MKGKVFDIENEPMPRGAWWWWFWLFFFDNPRNPARPRQLMVLWSTKNEKEIDCKAILVEKERVRGVVLESAGKEEKIEADFVISNTGPTQTV